VQNPAKWSAFVKSVLKNGLKMRELGPPCVALLAALCASKYSGLEEENKEQQLIADMLQSHSGDSVLQIYDILVWIRIRGSMPLTHGSGSCYFCH
jgi:hypothetical protein